MKSAWRGTLVDWASVNSGNIEEVDLNDYTDLLQVDTDMTKWEKEDEQFFFESDMDSSDAEIEY
jgi:hypothetical protein